MSKPILTVALQDDGSVTIDLAEGVSLNRDETAHGFAKILASIYRNIREIPETCGFPPAECNRVVAETLLLAERYLNGESTASGITMVKTPK